MRSALVLLLCSAVSVGAPPSFEYPAGSTSVQDVTRTTRDGVLVRDVTFMNAHGTRTAAYLVPGEGAAPHAAVLFVHWYEPKSADSNRTQFLLEAIALARDGVTSLLVETIWSDPDWFMKRDRSQDLNNSVQQVKDLRRALDVLLSQPGIDRQRVAYVGHDFGAMFGSVLAGVDPRVHVFAFQAGTPLFSDWYLLGTKLTGEAREKVVQELDLIDPIHYVNRLSGPVLFQFGRQDPYVPEQKANAFFAATSEPKEIRWYDAGHALNSQARSDRLAWLKKQLRLK